MEGRIILVIETPWHPENPAPIRCRGVRTDGPHDALEAPLEGGVGFRRVAELPKAVIPAARRHNPRRREWKLGQLPQGTRLSIVERFPNEIGPQPRGVRYAGLVAPRTDPGSRAEVAVWSSTSEQESPMRSSTASAVKNSWRMDLSCAWMARSSRN